MDSDIVAPDGSIQTDYGFYKFDEKTSRIFGVEEFVFNLKCIDEPYEIRGDGQSFFADTLMVTFELCDSKKRKCKSKAEMDMAMNGSGMVLLENKEMYKH